MTPPGPLDEVPPILHGHTSVIVGVGPGLGTDLSRTFAAAGARLLLASRNTERLAEVAGMLDSLGAGVKTIPTDVTSAGEVDHLAQRAIEAGPVHSVVYNAFVPPPMAGIAELSEDDWERSWQVNVLGAVRVARSFMPVLAESGGSMVMINSQAARRSQPGRAPYSATKAALLSVARTLAGELGPSGIRVNSVVPGQIRGPALEGHLVRQAHKIGSTPNDVQGQMAKDMALRRIVTGNEVANAALFLASPLASGITGQTLDVNAGNWWA